MERIAGVSPLHCPGRLSNRDFVSPPWACGECWHTCGTLAAAEAAVIGQLKRMWLIGRKSNKAVNWFLSAAHTAHNILRCKRTAFDRAAQSSHACGGHERIRSPDRGVTHPKLRANRVCRHLQNQPCIDLKSTYFSELPLQDCRRWRVTRRRHPAGSTFQARCRRARANLGLSVRQTTALRDTCTITTFRALLPYSCSS
jgi:hypothetical protein